MEKTTGNDIRDMPKPENEQPRLTMKRAGSAADANAQLDNGPFGIFRNGDSVRKRKK